MMRRASLCLATCYHAGMRRTTISAPDETLEKIRQIAAERHVSMADVIREALEEKAARHITVPRERRLPTSLGAGASGHTDTSVRIGEERPEPRSWR
jgi:Arc/MetJ-type ribon-helix-helix transcriptional regulator